MRFAVNQHLFVFFFFFIECILILECAAQQMNSIENSSTLVAKAATANKRIKFDRNLVSCFWCSSSIAVWIYFHDNGNVQANIFKLFRSQAVVQIWCKWHFCIIISVCVVVQVCFSVVEPKKDVPRNSAYSKR